MNYTTTNEIDNIAEAVLIGTEKFSEGEREEMLALGIRSGNGHFPSYPPPPLNEVGPPIRKQAMRAGAVLNEAYDYARPSSFSRGMRIELGDTTILLISGTASVDEYGKSIHLGDFRAQCWRTYRNITELLKSEGANWHDVVRTTCYLRDIERDYKDFNEVRSTFFRWLALDPLPASTGIQARLCREDLLVEIEAMAMVKANRGES